ncbi:unnamed protein product [Medioppia subpectinata]|uniref:Uncharacterized protein n=1 Tax=Medioppia subpectinata TaxID=1979941 RepID=A0A7R9Q7H2_9ACAR|nr:unnamed protein product [Medioppia subpectinata]CAG2114307.1 unnamed protein product [Medioppia subpectinata]
MNPGVRDLSDGELPYSEHQSVGDYDIKQMISSQDESIYDLFMNLIPDNIIAATFTTHYTALVALDPHNLTLGYKKVSERAFKPNMLAVIVAFGSSSSIFSLIMTMSLPGAPTGGSSIVTFLAYCAIIGGEVTYYD